MQAKKPLKICCITAIIYERFIYQHQLYRSNCFTPIYCRFQECQMLISSSWVEYLIEWTVNKAEIEDSTVIISLIIFERFLIRTSAIWKPNLIYYFMTSLLIALKLNQDEIYDLESYAKIVQIHSSTLCYIELEILSILDWKVNVTLSSFRRFNRRIVSLIEHKGK